VRRAAASGAALLAVLLAGCGLGPGATRGGSGAQLRVTRDFGQRQLVTASQTKLHTSDTVMRLLASKAKITTRYGGGFVQSINGVSASESAAPHDWFYFVNGTEAPTGAAQRKLKPGDVVQWDYRDWQVTPHVPAIVGAFPEPFLHGLDGTQYPTRVECASGAAKACDTVTSELGDVGVSAGTGSAGAEARGGVFRIEVGTWKTLGGLGELQPLLKGPKASGVYARFTGPKALQLLDARGDVVRRAPPGSGLVAALIPAGQQPLWVVTGVDAAGVARAAALLKPAILRNAYAVAALPSGPQRLPLEASR
jgi:hypothetical protein